MREGGRVPRLILVAYAVAPGTGGAEALVNAALVRALASHWPGAVTVISGGAPPALGDGSPASSLRGWRVHALGECGARGEAPPVLSRLADTGLRSLRRGGPASLPARVAERAVFLRTGAGLKAAGWTRAAARVLKRELGREPDAVVYTRALPFWSLRPAAAAARRRRLRWIANLNDPVPPGIWPGQYAVPPRVDRGMREGLQAMLPRIGGFTFPSAQLREIEVAAFPEMARAPFEIVRHVAGSRPECTPRREEGTLLLAFAGSLRRDRCRRELAEALAGLRERDSDAASRLRISFYLPHPMPWAEEYARSLAVETRISVGLPEAELQRSLADADILLDLESEVDRPLLMTKLATYSAFGRPVWALCASGGTTWEILGETGWGYRSALGVSALESLARIHRDWREGRLAAPSPAVVEMFSPRRQVEALLRLVARVV